MVSVQERENQVKYKSALVTSASGSVGGMTASHNSGGMYMRARAIPVNTNTAFQQAMRSALGLLQARFANTLTGAQRTAWAVFAQNVGLVDSLGNTIHVSGQSMYIKCNSIRSQAGKTIIDAGPTIYDLAALTIPVPTIVAAGTTVSVAYTNTDAWAGAVGGHLLVYASRPQNATINYFNGPYRFAGSVNGAGTPPTSPAVITLPFTIGPAGSAMFFRFVATLADGRPSASFRVKANA